MSTPWRPIPHAEHVPEPPDLHECSRCGRLVCEQEVDDDASEALEVVCDQCAARERDEEEGEQ